MLFFQARREAWTRTVPHPVRGGGDQSLACIFVGNDNDLHMFLINREFYPRKHQVIMDCSCVVARYISESIRCSCKVSFYRHDQKAKVFIRFFFNVYIQ